MAQNIWGTIVPSSTSGNSLATLLNDFKDAVVTGFSGTVRPPNLQAGGYWVDTTNNPTTWAYKLWTGSVDITVFTLNLTTGSPSFGSSDSLFQINKISADSAAPILKFLKERIANNGQTLIGDVLGEMQFVGAANDNSNPICCRVRAVATDDAISTENGAALVFETTETNSAALIETLRMIGGKVGIGTTNPLNTLHTKGSGIRDENESDTTTGPKVILRKKRVSGNGQVLSGDVVGAIEAKSTDQNGAELSDAATMEVIATENHTDTVRGSKISVKVAKTGQGSASEVASFGGAADFSVDTIAEKTAAAGVTIDGVLIKDGAIAKAVVGLTNVTDDAQLKRAANDWAGFTEKTLVADADLVLIEDSADSGNKKKVQMSNLGGGGSGAGSKNYFSTQVYNGDSVTGFSQYHDSTATPVDLTGGSPSGNFEVVVSSSSPLRGANSIILRKKNTANCVGEGVSYLMNIDPADYGAGRVLRFTMDYGISSGTYNTGDVVCWIYCVTGTGGLKPLTANSIQNHTLVADKCQMMEVQIPTDCTQLRFGFHCAVTTTNNFDIKMDSLLFGPQEKSYGSVVTDEESYTGSLSYGGTTATNITSQTYKKSRSGDKLTVKAYILFNGAANANGSICIPMPSGLSIDTSKTAGAYSTVGYASAFLNGNKHYTGHVRLDNNSTTYVTIHRWDDSGANDSDWAGNTTAGSNVPGGVALTSSDGISLNFTVPIVGWSSSQILSSDSDTRVTAARYTTANTTSLANATFTAIDFGTKSFDTHGAVLGAGGGNVTTFGTGGGGWRYVVPSPGKYEISTGMGVTSGGGWAAGESIILSAYKNGGEYERLNQVFSQTAHTAAMMATGSTTMDCITGDVIQIGFYQDSGAALNMNGTGQYVDIRKIQGPAQIAASETSALRYKTAAGQSIPNAAFTIIDFGTKDFDYGIGTITTGVNWKFQPAISGLYEISGFIEFNNGGGWAVGEEVAVDLYKNGSSMGIRLGGVVASVAHGTYIAVPLVSTPVRLLSTDYIDVRVYQNSGASLSLLNAADMNWIAIKSVGNY